jgi:hypothetical protein
MIDKLSALSKRVVWLIPLLYTAAAIALAVFGYVILVYDGEKADAFLIPCIIILLWSLVSAILLSTFPNVPSRAEEKLPLAKRFKIALTRLGYHLGAWVFVFLSIILVWLSVKLLNVWRGDF